MAKAVELGVTNLQCEGDGTIGGDGAATAIGRRIFQLAGAAIVAIAVAGRLASDQPIDACRGPPPSRIIDGQR